MDRSEDGICLGQPGMYGYISQSNTGECCSESRVGEAGARECIGASSILDQRSLVEM